MNLRPLTKRQHQVFTFLCAHIREKGFAPSLAEICEQFHLSSLATVHKHLEHLRERGYIARRWNFSRSIEINRRAVDGRCPLCGCASPAPQEPT